MNLVKGYLGRMGNGLFVISSMVPVWHPVEGGDNEYSLYTANGARIWIPNQCRPGVRMMFGDEAAQMQRGEIIRVNMYGEVVR